MIPKGETKDYLFNETQFILKANGTVSENPADILDTAAFKQVIDNFLAYLRKKDDPLLRIFAGRAESACDDEIFELIKLLAVDSRDKVLEANPKYVSYFKDNYALEQFVEELYNFWRNYKRYFITYGNEGNRHHDRPYRTFNNTIEILNDHVRGIYRDIAENISGQHPRIYRQVAAGCEIGVIARDQLVSESLGQSYDKLSKIPIIRQILIEPPLILDPPMNKRSGRFEPVDYNLLEEFTPDPKEFICFPAKVGDLIIHVYFHMDFIGLGVSMCNLFEIASTEDLDKKPDAVYVYGVDPEVMKDKKVKTIFYDDPNGPLIGFVPREDQFGYFGYVKKMVLTLHNVIQMKRGKMPVHGAMACIKLKDGSAANVVIIGDSGAGKSETLEALRVLSEEHIRNMTLVFDDMGTLDIAEASIKAYGTEVGAFVRLDDLSPGFAYGSIDRSIIMSPQKINARAILPITTIEEVLYGHKVDMLLYANNYEAVDDSKPTVEWFDDSQKAFDVFKNGARMAKGTTTEIGLTESYFANPFGPDQFKEVHEPIAKKFFESFASKGVKVGVLRTQLGLEGKETDGPQEASEALFEVIREK